MNPQAQLEMEVGERTQGGLIQSPVTRILTIPKAGKEKENGAACNADETS